MNKRAYFYISSFYLKLFGQKNGFFQQTSDGAHIDMLITLFYDGIDTKKDRHFDEEDYQYAQVVPFLPH